MKKRGGAADELLFVPLGGAGEIGMNLALYGVGGRWLMVDCGMTFADESLPGVDIVVPDPEFIAARKDDLVGLVLTHAHEDHLGAVAHLWERLGCPVYATPFAAALLRRKLAEAGLESQVPLDIVETGKPVDLDPFTVTWIAVAHSIPEAHALAIETPQGVVIHSGDWKIDPEPVVGPRTDEAAFRRWGEAGVLAFVGDSTNVFVTTDGGSEGSLRGSLAEIVAAKRGRVCITSFASNVARIATVGEVARATGRRLVVAGRSFERILACARETGYLAGLPPLVDEDEAGYLPPDEALYLVTGCQGEARGALSRIVMGEHKALHLEAGDTLIFSSRQIPGNERDIARIMDRCALDGVEVVTWRDALVHVSGHPVRDDLVAMYGWVRPKIAVTVHGEARHLAAHAKVAAETGIAQTVAGRNGEVIRLAPGRAAKVDHVPVGRLAIEQGRAVPLDSPMIRERRKVAFNGAAVVALVLDLSGDVVADPAVAAIGWHEDPEAGRIEMQRAIRAAVEGLAGAKRLDDGAVAEAARRAVRKLAPEGRRPLIDVQILRLDGRSRVVYEDAAQETEEAQ